MSKTDSVRGLSLKVATINGIVVTSGKNVTIIDNVRIPSVIEDKWEPEKENIHGKQ